MASTFQVYSPVDGTVYLERSLANAQEINKALQLADQAKRSWQSVPIAERASICKKAVDYLLEKADEIGEEISWQMGRPLRYTPYEIKKGLKERADYMINIAPAQLSDIIVPPIPGFKRYIKRQALGTVLVLAPWNYPFLTSVNAIIPSLMAGNTVLLKHALQTPLCAERFAEAFAYAGLPAGVFQYLHMDHDQVAKVIKDARIDFVAFTGSVAGGEAVQKAIGARFIHAGLELGGKDPAYVRKDVDLQKAIENLVDGAYFNSGQSCCGIERIYVHEDVYRDFVDGFVALTRQYKLGNPLQQTTTLGPLVRPSAVEFVKKQIQEAQQLGAEALIDPSEFAASELGPTYMAPQVLIGVKHQMDLMQTESFAPVVGIMPVRNDAEAIQLMNDSDYGLTASVWTKDLEAAERIGEQIVTGTFFMNRCDYLDPALAWTGVKNSGKGCTLSGIGYEVLTRPKSYHLKLD